MLTNTDPNVVHLQYGELSYAICEVKTDLFEREFLNGEGYDDWELKRAIDITKKIKDVYEKNIKLFVVTKGEKTNLLEAFYSKNLVKYVINIEHELKKEFNIYNYIFKDAMNL